VPALRCLAWGRPRRSRRLFGVLATLAALGLGAANPAFASGGETPDPAPTPVTPVIAVPEPEAVPDGTSDADFATSPQLDLPQVETSIQTDGVNTNVDVRVLSPGNDGAVTQADAAPGVISAGVGPDITSSGNPASTGGSSSTDGSATSATTPQSAIEPTDVAGSQGANTNVSVRVLSPGDDGPVTQVNGSGEASPSAGVDPQSSPSDSITGETTSSQADSPQYHNSNSQAQSSDSSSEEPWYWQWTLTSNCADINDSISTETGDPKSLDWHWQWQWNWSCDGTGTSTDTTGRNERSLPSDPSGSTADSSTGQSEPGPTATTAQPDGTWSWTWNFVLCGSETTVARTAASGTPLTWDWSWAWNWTCPPGANHDGDTASGEADTTPGAAAEPTVDDAPVPSDAVMTPDAVEPTPDATAATSTALDPRSIMRFLRGFILRSGTPAVLGRMPLALTVAGLPTVVASEAGLVPVDRTSVLLSVNDGGTPSDVAPEATRFVSRKSPTVPQWPDRTAQPVRPGASATTTSESAEPASHARTPAPHPTPEARPAPRATSTSSSSHEGRKPVAPPLGPQGWLQLAGSASGAGNASNLIPFGFATVTGFFVLAPPRLRRRARPAQELGPRDRYPSPIDDPG
jgi:hypothetical protein